MSLLVDLYVNAPPTVGRLIIVREKGTADPDSINTYSYRVIDGSQVIKKGDGILHRYGDGCFTLLRDVLIDAGEVGHR
jgi:hypothetical protein